MVLERHIAYYFITPLLGSNETIGQHYVLNDTSLQCDFGIHVVAPPIISYHLLCHDREEVAERNLPRAFLIHVTRHLLDFLLLWLEP